MNKYLKKKKNELNTYICFYSYILLFSTTIVIHFNLLNLNRFELTSDV